MSQDDIDAERNHAAATKAATDLPLVGLTTGTDGSWSGRFWNKVAPRTYEKSWCESVRVVGPQFAITYAEHLRPKPPLEEELTRTVSAWGEDIQSILMRLRVGIIGAGSVGSIVAEALARIGISDIMIMDFDTVETVNLDRLLHATRQDVGRPKVEVLATALNASATSKQFNVRALDHSVVEDEGFREALDCDILFSCVDRPWPRNILNFLAYAHLIPVIDGGIFIEARKDGTGVKRADWRAHVASPGHRCLECLGQYNPSLVSAERDGYLDDPTYISGLPPDHPLRRRENVFAFSLGAASLEVLQFLSLIVSPNGLARPGSQMYHFIPGILDADHNTCEATCIYQDKIALGDRSGLSFTGRHDAAEKQRALRKNVTPDPSLRQRWKRLIVRVRNMVFPGSKSE